MRENKSFTLIELLVVVAIIGVLVAIVMPGISNARAKARDARRVEDLRTLSLALEMYYSDYNHYPIWESDCIDQEANNPLIGGEPSSPVFFTNKYVARPPKDPLSKYCYFYKSDASGSKYKLAAYLELDKEKALNDGGNIDEDIYEVFSFGYGEQVTLSSEDVNKIIQETSEPSCGNDIVEAGEECDEGDDNSDEPNASCRTNCELAGCGDDILDEGEECDTSGFLADGLTTCSDICEITPGACAGLSGLISYWKLDETSGETASDSAGTNNGTLLPSETGPVWTTEETQVAGALSFDGDDDYVDLSALSNIGKEITVSVWIKPLEAGTINYIIKPIGFGGPLIGIVNADTTIRSMLQVEGVDTYMHSTPYTVTYGE